MIEMTLRLAERAASAALAKAAEMGVGMTVSIVDEAGRLVLTLRGDGTGFFTTDTSRAKAVAAVSFRRPTQELVALRESNAAFWSAVPAVARGEILPSTGGVPITREGRVIGAIGCGGGSPEQDHVCAAAGAADANGLGEADRLR
ncbi:MAG: heme-binding protein [Betaproteobacteria bacterium]|nr:heme-binding protein [Betaproteobacteria bacterium]